MAEPNCLPVAEAAKLLGVTPGRIRQLMDGGELGSMIFSNGKRLVSAASLRRLMDEREAQRGRNSK